MRKSWSDADSQLGAFEILRNAQRLAEKNAGYSVYDPSGVRIWPNVASGSGAQVKRGSSVSNVWKQSALGGVLAAQLKKHGCGACCAAAAVNLAGGKASPQQVLQLGEKLWGKPAGKESYALSCIGIVHILKALGINAKAYTDVSRSQIKNALLAGKTVICFTRAYDANDPFAGGDHYVLAVGMDKADKVVVANSGGAKRVQVVPLETLYRYIYKGASGKDKQWLKSSAGSAGIVIVG